MAESIEYLNRRADDSPLFDDTEPWPDPMSLDPPPVPSFPVECLPEWTQDLARGVAAAVGVAADLSSTAILGVLAGAVAKKAVVQLHDSHYEPLALYQCAVRPPGALRRACNMSQQVFMARSFRQPSAPCA